MLQFVAVAVVVLLIANVVTALVVSARRRILDRWLLTVLLTGTSGAAIIATLTLLAGAGARRFLDVAVVLIALTALTAAVRIAAAQRPAEMTRDETR